MRCSACDKDMLDKDGDTMSAAVISIFYPKDPECAKVQMGKYDMETVYSVCFECLLEVLKVKS